MLTPDVNECSSTPCLNDGHCFDKFGGYICKCRGGFEGVHCETGMYFGPKFNLYRHFSWRVVDLITMHNQTFLKNQSLVLVFLS